jgi:hypothetical protein
VSYKVVEITRSWADFSLASGNVVCFPTPLRNMCVYVYVYVYVRVMG